VTFNTRNEFHGIVLAASACAGLAQADGARAESMVHPGFVGSLTGGNASVGPGGGNSAELAIRLRNADPDTKYTCDRDALDDECKPTVTELTQWVVALDPVNPPGNEQPAMAFCAELLSAGGIEDGQLYGRAAPTWRTRRMNTSGSPI